MILAALALVLVQKAMTGAFQLQVVLLDGTIAVASEEVDGESETGVSVSVPLGEMSVTVSATDGDDWKAGVSTSLAGALFLRASTTMSSQSLVFQQQ